VIYGLLALSLTFVWGHAGLFSFGQAAFFGVGGYTYGVIAINVGVKTNETITAVVLGVCLAAAFAALVGYFIIYGNVSEVYLAIITLATSLVLYTLMSTTASPDYHIGDAQLGGYNGMQGVLPLTVGMTPDGVPNAIVLHQQLALLAAIAIVIVLGLRALLRRPFGRIVVSLRENEERTELLGYNVRAYKLAVFVIGGAVAGLAGALFAAWGTFIDPTVFALQQAALVGIWVLLGGRTSLVGAFVGVALVQELTSRVGSGNTTATPILLGGMLILVVLLLPRGIVPSFRDVFARLRGVRGRGIAARSEPVVAQPRNATLADAFGDRDALTGLELGAKDVAKEFGGVAAVAGVNLTFPPQGVACLIGPNGAGKSTLFGLLAGRHRPTKGDVVLAGESITGLRPHARAKRGIGIKLQVASLFQELSTRENVWLAAYAHLRDASAADERADAVLSWLGMGHRADDDVAVLSHGERQWLEIGMVVAGGPRVILLDEPTAGMSREETARTADLITALGEHATVVVVEHDMEFVRLLGVPVTVLHEGRVFAQGSLADIRKDDRVLDIYLGRAHAAA
jgi:branched-chain amino acid transport system permease protein